MNIFLLIITISIANFSLFFNNVLTKNENFSYILDLFLLILVWLGWIIGGQLSIIHLINF